MNGSVEIERSTSERQRQDKQSTSIPVSKTYITASLKYELPPYFDPPKNFINGKKLPRKR